MKRVSSGNRETTKRESKCVFDAMVEDLKETIEIRQLLNKLRRNMKAMAEIAHGVQAQWLDDRTQRSCKGRQARNAPHALARDVVRHFTKQLATVRHCRRAPVTVGCNVQPPSLMENR